MTSSPSIFFVHPDLGIGGAERLVVDTAVGLQERGYKVTMYTTHHDPSHCFEETRNGTLKVNTRGHWLFPCSFFGMGYLVFTLLRNSHMALSIVLDSLLFGNKPDIIFTDQLSATIPILKLTGAKIYFYCHFPDKLLSQRGNILKEIYRLPLDLLEDVTTAMADGIAVNSKFTQGVFKASFPKIRVIPKILYPGIRIEAYKSSFDDDSSVQPLIRLCEKKTVILSINRFERKKNVALAIKSFGIVKSNDKRENSSRNLILVIAGGYDSRVTENVQHHKELERIAKDAGLVTITLHRDRIQEETKLTEGGTDIDLVFLLSFNENQRSFLFSASSCLLYTPRNEHFGIVPVEAMWSGLPVVAVNSGGPCESVLEGQTGFLCEDTPILFAEGLEKILRLSVLQRQQMAQISKVRVQERFTLEVFIKELDEELEKLMRLPIEFAYIHYFVIFASIMIGVVIIKALFH